MNKLDEIAVNIELVLISLIQGVALVTLGEQAVHALNDPEWYSYITFIIAGLAILLGFWAQSILHAISFIRWPVRIEHMFVYFVAGLVQIIAYTHIDDMPGWFFWWSLFSLVALCMYVLDLWIIRDSHKQFAQLRGGEDFLKAVETRHLFEMKYLVPAAFCFNVFFWLVALVFPSWFESPWVYTIPGLLQLAFSAYALYDGTLNFRARSEMIGNLFLKQEKAK